MARLREDVSRIAARAYPGAGVSPLALLALAVSGGPDSVAMLALAAAAFPGRVVVATFDHRLRAGSADEAAMVAALCGQLGVPHVTLVPDTPIVGSSIQMRARESRYAALIGWAGRAGAAALLTAHHADDQAETLLMRLNRASGVAGLTGIRAWRREGELLILRPLLDWRRVELRRLASEAGLPFVDDPSNGDPRHDRARIRATLAAMPEIDPVRLARSAAYLAEAEEVLAGEAERLWGANWQGSEHGLAIGGEAREMRRRLLRRAIGATRVAFGIERPPFSDSANVEALLDALEAGVAGVQGGVKVEATTRGWRFFPAPPRRS